MVANADEFRRELAGTLLAVHRMAARFMRSEYRPLGADFEEVAGACIESIGMTWLRAFVRALAPLVKVDALLTRLEALRRKARAA